MSAWPRFFLAALLVSTLALGMFGIGRSLWLDEAWVANSIHAPTLREMFFYPDWLQTSPPLFLLLSRGVVSIWGFSNTSLRVAPLGLALLATGALFSLSRRMLSLPWAVLATTLVIFHPAFIEYAHSTKQYSGEVATTVLVLLAAVRYLERPSRGEYFLLVAALVIGLFAAYPVAFLIPGILWAVYSSRSLLKKGDRQPFSPQADSDNQRDRAAKKESVPFFQQAPRARGLAMAAAASLLTLWAVFLRPNTAPELRAFWAADAEALFTPGLIAAVLLVLALTFRLAFSLKNSRQWSQLICAMPCLLLAVASLSHWYPATQRMRLWVLPCFVLLAVSSLQDLLGKTSPRVGAMLALACAVLFASANVHRQLREHRDQPEEDFSGAFQYLKEHVGPSDLLLVHAAAREGFRLYSDMLGWTGPPPVYGDTGWPCCARGKSALPGESSEAAVVADLNRIIPPLFSGKIWLFYPTRPSHWDYTGRNEGDLWRKLVWERGCPPGPYVALKNLAISPMECGPLPSTPIR